MIHDCRNKLHSFSNIDPIISWVPAHLEHGGFMVDGNETADKLANKGREQAKLLLVPDSRFHNPRVDEEIGTPYTLYKREITIKLTDHRAPRSSDKGVPENL